MAEEKTEDLKIIDWDEAMNQVGGDREFLSEVLGDLLQESNTAEEEIYHGIQNQDFTAVMKAAHRIKGSASYLCCEQLRWYSWKLQDVGQAASQNPSLQLRQEIDQLYASYRSSLAKLKEEIGKDSKRK
jgi:HPt (histidine-containing phosphotransfer) domain-containing protein